ncbi:MAG: 4Fe-4S dicluster domain-containing protein [Defluviitaleaceae bacterium]|nr:4Fe-4S dicluster domain-containing protein [Defluviitaleaceae bacterium]
MQALTSKAYELLEAGKIDSVLGWTKGDMPYDATPALFDTCTGFDKLVYNGFCGGNLSKYLVGRHDRTLVFLKPCDTYSLNQLLSEHRVNRDNVYAVGIGCGGMIDINKLKAFGFKGITDIADDGESLTVHTLYGDKDGKKFPKANALLEKCQKCKGKDHMIYDEIILPELSKDTTMGSRFTMVEKIENMDADKRFEFWRSELSKCIRCNTCRNTCPACTCNQCVFDNPKSGVQAKVNATDFEENLFHIIRAYHVAGRCSDCGECTRVCPQAIPLHLLNRKFIKDMNAFYGEYQAGETAELGSPLLHFSFDDAEPNAVSDKPDKGGAQ